MIRTTFLTVTLLGCTAWMAAQTTSSSSETGSTSSQNELSRKQAGSQSNTGQNTMGNESLTGMNGNKTDGNKMALTGCISGSAGNYMLTEASGTKYQLEGDTSKLSTELNNQVEVKGTASGSGSGSASSSSSGTDSSASATTGHSAGNSSAETFNVSSVKRISSSCTGSGK